MPAPRRAQPQPDDFKQAVVSRPPASLCKSTWVRPVGLTKAFNCGIHLPGGACINAVESIDDLANRSYYRHWAVGAFVRLYRRRLDVLTGPWMMRE